MALGNNGTCMFSFYIALSQELRRMTINLPFNVNRILPTMSSYKYHLIDS